MSLLVAPSCSSVKRCLRVDIPKLVPYYDGTIPSDFESVGALYEFAGGFQLEGRQEGDVQVLVLASGDEVRFIPFCVGDQQAYECRVVGRGSDESSSARRRRER